MALIALQPGESFEHYHEYPSTTKLLTGELILTINNKQELLQINKPLSVPQHTPHTVKNIGKVVATFECACASGGGGEVIHG
jgi:mannose-6-phosphate isomerase-like protein (cupin superfamily)